MSSAARIYLAVGLGAALGSLARWLVSLGLLACCGNGFAWGTLAVNLLGSFLIGLYATISEPDGRLPSGPALRQFWLAGFCGGFTTFSIFSLEAVLFVQRGEWLSAAVQVLLLPPLWLLAVWVGYRVGERVNRCSSRG